MRGVVLALLINVLTYTITSLTLLALASTNIVNVSSLIDTFAEQSQRFLLNVKSFGPSYAFIYNELPLILITAVGGFAGLALDAAYAGIAAALTSLNEGVKGFLHSTLAYYGLYALHVLAVVVLAWNHYLLLRRRIGMRQYLAAFVISLFLTSLQSWAIWLYALI